MMLNNIDKVVDRVHDIFSMFGWTWYEMDSPPTKQQIKEAIEEMYVSLIEFNQEDPDTDWISTGRLRLVKETSDKENNIFDLIIDVELGSILGDEDSEL